MLDSSLPHDCNDCLFSQVILFDFWRIDSVGGLVGSMVGCFLLALVYEAVKFYKDFLHRRRSCASFPG